MSYIDGYVLPIKKDKIEDYKKIASMAAIVWKDHGALDYKEAIADDINIENFVHYPDIIKAESDEVVVFAYVLFNSREHRDEVNKKVFADPRLECSQDNMPFDCKKMAYGGFKTIVGD